MIRAHEYPVVGLWYWDIEHQEQFEIVARDDKFGSIEIQFFSGDIQEVDLDTWYEMRVVSIAAPKDWSGPFDIEKDEFTEFSNETSDPHRFRSPKSSFEEDQ